MLKNKRMRNLIVVFFCLVLIGACSTTEDVKVLAGPAPNFTLEDISGKPLSLNEIKGRSLSWISGPHGAVRASCPFLNSLICRTNISPRAWWLSGSLWMMRK